jgi:hypothetical protein
MKTNRLLVLVGAAILIVGSRLPWMSYPVLFGSESTFSRALEIGWEDNGFFTLGFGMILLLIGIFWKSRAGKPYSLPGAVLAVLAILEVIGCFARILEIDPAAGFFAATKYGIFVTLAGALLALIGTLMRSPMRAGKPVLAPAASLP